MVYQPTQPSEIKKKHKRSRAMQIALDVLTLLLVAGATYAIFRLTSVKPENQESNNPDVVNKVPTDEEEEESEQWLTKTVRSWVSHYPRNFRTGVIVYDFDNETTLAEVSPDEAFEGHEESELGKKFSITTSEKLTAREMMEVVKTAYKHDGMNEEDWGAVKQELLTQSDIYSEARCQGYCRTRLGLPLGFENAKNIYNENYQSSNGSLFTVYRDAAIVEYATSDGRERHFGVVLLAQNFADQSEFVKLSKSLDQAIVAHFSNEPLK